jgi:hypothetical protein
MCSGTSVPTLPFDVLLDVFFLLDILLQFNLGVRNAGEYKDNRKYITMNYLKGSFLFDLLTSIPVSVSSTKSNYTRHSQKLFRFFSI